MMAETGKRYWATVPFDYYRAGEPRRSLDRGQVTTLLGAPGDEKLTRLGYFREVPAKAALHRCAACGAEFVDLGARTGHGDLRHKAHAFDSPDAEDGRLERQYEIAQRLTPLNLEATTASQRG